MRHLGIRLRLPLRILPTLCLKSTQGLDVSSVYKSSSIVVKNYKKITIKNNYKDEKSN